MAAFDFLKKKKKEDKFPPLGGADPTMPSMSGFGQPPSDMSLGAGIGMDDLGGAPLPPVGGLSKPAEEPIKLLTEDLEEISEAIIAEKWSVLSKELDKTKDSIKKTNDAIERLQERMNELDKKMESAENAIFGKVDDYGKGISDVKVEMKAMQKVFQTMMPAFSENIKELQSLVEKTKSKKHK